MFGEQIAGGSILIYTTVLSVLILLLTCRYLGSINRNRVYKRRDLRGKTVILTGASSGIGYEVAAELLKRGSKLIISVLSEEEGEETCRKLEQSSKNSNIGYRIMDLASFKSIRTFVDDVERTEESIDILINNAAVMLRQYEETEDGLDRTLQVNYFGPFLLTNLLLDLLKKSQSALIIHVTTGFVAQYAGGINIDHLNNFDNALRTYCRSKLYLRLFNYELSKKLTGFHIRTLSVHPGDCYTNLFTDMSMMFRFFTRIWMLFQRSIKEASRTILYCIDSDELNDLSSKHFENFEPMYRDALIETNEYLSEDFWNKSAELVKLT